jgi:hypothetical protein
LLGGAGGLRESVQTSPARNETAQQVVVRSSEPSRFGRPPAWLAASQYQMRRRQLCRSTACLNTSACLTPTATPPGQDDDRRPRSRGSPPASIASRCRLGPSSSAWRTGGREDTRTPGTSGFECGLVAPSGGASHSSASFCVAWFSRARRLNRRGIVETPGRVWPWRPRSRIKRAPAAAKLAWIVQQQLAMLRAKRRVFVASGDADGLIAARELTARNVHAARIYLGKIGHLKADARAPTHRATGRD